MFSRLTYAAFSVLVLLCGAARGQGVVVDWSLCSDCGVISLTGVPECAFEDTWCERYDLEPEVVSNGTTSISSSSVAVCHRCGDCAEPGDDIDQCEVPVSVTVTGDDDVNISSDLGLDAGIVQATLLDLAYQHGISKSCQIALSYTASVHACRWKKIRGDLEVVSGRKVRQRHFWRWAYTTRTNTDPLQNPGQQPCPLNGSPHYQDCRESESYVRVTLGCTGNGTIGVIASGDCPIPGDQ